MLLELLLCSTLMWRSSLIFRYHLYINALALALYNNHFQTDAEGESSCDFTTCDPAPTAAAVEAFAASNQVLPLYHRPVFLCSFVLPLCHRPVFLCSFVLPLCHRPVFVTIWDSSARCGYPRSQKCSPRCWPMARQSSMNLKMLENPLFLIISIYCF